MIMQVMGGEEMETAPMDLTRQSAMFVLKTRDGKRLTQAATDSILGDVTELFQSRFTSVCDTTLQLLKEAEVDDVTLSTIKNAFTSQCEPFRGLETEYRQNAYIRDHFGFIVRYTVKFLHVFIEFWCYSLCTYM